MAAASSTSRPRFSDAELLFQIWHRHLKTDIHSINYTQDLGGTSDFKVIESFAGGLNEVRNQNKGTMVQTSLYDALDKVAVANEAEWHLAGFRSQWAEETAKKLRAMARHYDQAILKAKTSTSGTIPDWLGVIMAKTTTGSPPADKEDTKDTKKNKRAAASKSKAPDEAAQEADGDKAKQPTAKDAKQLGPVEFDECMQA